jgi:predicted AlkP superfamily pyrophosphatase or phosphodiesterase
MFMGACPESHGYTEWGSRTPEIPSRMVNEHGIFPTVFSLLREADPGAGIGCLYDWEGIKFLVDTLALDYHAQSPGYSEQPAGLCDMAAEYILTQKPALAAICFDELDHAGHADGHDSPGYYRTLSEIDGYVGRIVEAVRQAGIAGNTVIIVTADHGGIDKGHGGKTLREMQVPFIIAGKGIRQGGAFTQSMMIYDVASTIAHIFALQQPQVWIGRPAAQVFTGNIGTE